MEGLRQFAYPLFEENEMKNSEDFEKFGAEAELKGVPVCGMSGISPLRRILDIPSSAFIDLAHTLVRLY